MNLIQVLWFETNQKPVTRKIGGYLKSFEQEIGNYIKSFPYKKDETSELLLITNMDIKETSLDSIPSPCFLVKINSEGKYVSLSDEEVKKILVDLK